MFTTFDELRDRASAVISYRVGTVLSSRVSYSHAIVEPPFGEFRKAKQVSDSLLNPEKLSPHSLRPVSANSALKQLQLQFSYPYKKEEPNDCV